MYATALQAIHLHPAHALARGGSKQRRSSGGCTLARARPSADIGPGAPYESDQTTHYSVVDSQGNAVSNTYTLNFSYGLGLVAPGTGVAGY